MTWITCDHVPVDHGAIPWLVRPFVHPDAKFLFAPRDEVRDRAAREEAIPFDVPRTGLGASATAAGSPT